MNLICKKDYIQLDKSRKKINFTVSSVYKVNLIAPSIIVLTNDNNEKARFFTANGVLLYVYDYFYTEQTSRDIILSRLIN